MMIERIKTSLGLLPDRGGEYYPKRGVLENTLDAHPQREGIVAYIETHGGSVRRDLLHWPRNRGGVLTDVGIIRHMLAGNIVIDPFSTDQLTSNSYDVRVSDKFFRHREADEMELAGNALTMLENSFVYDAYSPKGINVTWAGPVDTIPAAEMKDKVFWALKGGVYRIGQHDKTEPFKALEEKDQLIFIHPNEMILGTTMEAIGGRNIITTTISGKSTLGRHGYEICGDANLGDVGFVFPLALEIFNKHQKAAVYLVVGTPVARLVFHELTEPPLQTYRGSYMDQGDGRSVIPKPLKVIRD